MTFRRGYKKPLLRKQGAMVHFIRYWLPVIVYCTIIFVQSSYPSPEQLPRFPFSDKLMHAIAYGILGALICRASNSVDQWRHNWGVLVLIGVVASTVYGLSDEWHQSFVDGRSSELSDLIADFAGGLAGSVIYVWFLRMRFKSAAT